MNTYKWNELTDKGYKKQMTRNRGATHSYTVTKPANEDWPEKNELISFCDGGPGMNFGGKVREYGDTASVDVYVD